MPQNFKVELSIQYRSVIGTACFSSWCAT